MSRANRSHQKIFVIRRVGSDPPQYSFEGFSGSWTTNVALAGLVSRRKFSTVVRCDLGLDESDVEMIEVIPQLEPAL